MSTAVNAMKDRVQDRVNAWLGRPPTGAEHAVRVPRLPTGPDRLLCAVVLALAALGVVMVFSAGAAFAAKKYGDWTYFLKREALYAVVGVAAFVFGLRTDYGHYRRWSYPLLFLYQHQAVDTGGTRFGFQHGARRGSTRSPRYVKTN